MDIGSLLIGLALLLLVGFIIAQPVLEKRAASEKALNPGEQLVLERDLVLGALRDLDFDHATGKIADEDYTPQRAQLVARGVELLKQMDGLGLRERSGSEADDIEQAIAARRQKRAAPGAGAAARACASCGAQAQPGDRFCPACGAGLDQACPACGRPVVPGDKFCAGCGAALAAPAAAGRTGVGA